MLCLRFESYGELLFHGITPYLLLALYSFLSDNEKKNIQKLIEDSK